MRRKEEISSHSGLVVIGKILWHFIEVAGKIIYHARTLVIKLMFFIFCFYYFFFFFFYPSFIFYCYFCGILLHCINLKKGDVMMKKIRSIWGFSPAFTLIELLVVIAILAEMLLPALHMYRNEYDEMNPPGYYANPRTATTPWVRWYTLLYDLTQNQDIFVCPSRPEWYWEKTYNKIWGGYSINADCNSGTNPVYDERPSSSCYHEVVYDSEVINSAGTIQAGDAWGVCYSGGTPSYTITGIQNSSIIEQNCTSNLYNYPDRETYEADRDRHNGGLNYLFYDGHVEWHRAEYILENATALFDRTVPGP